MMPTDSWDAVGLTWKDWLKEAAVPLVKAGVSAPDAAGIRAAAANDVTLMIPSAAAARRSGRRAPTPDHTAFPPSWSVRLPAEGVRHLLRPFLPRPVTAVTTAGRRLGTLTPKANKAGRGTCRPAGASACAARPPAARPRPGSPGGGTCCR